MHYHCHLSFSSEHKNTIDKFCFVFSYNFKFTHKRTMKKCICIQNIIYYYFILEQKQNDTDGKKIFIFLQYKFIITL